MRSGLLSGSKTILLAGLFASSMSVLPVMAQSVHGQAAPAATPAPAHTPMHKTSPYRPSVPASAKNYHQVVWGIDNLLVRQTASGNLIRFSYRVTDPARAKALGDKKATPYLVGQRSRAVLQIPVMNKIGQLRQTGLPETGKEYWMVFSNKGNLVRPGDRVNVIIGSFHADGLMVE
jgi:hypothetical protein